jgi:hypothetical protein
MLDRAGSGYYWNELFRFSTTERTWELLNASRVSGPPPSAQSGHGMVSVGSDLYVFGGFRWYNFDQAKGEQGLCDDGYTQSSGCVPDKAPRRCSARFCCACCHTLCSCGVKRLKDALRAAAGDIYSLNELLRFSTTERKWEQLNATRVSGSPPSPRHSHNMVAMGSDLYVFEGVGATVGGYDTLNDCFRFSTTEKQWEQLGAPRVSPPSARDGHAMVAVGSDLYVFGVNTNHGDTRRCDAGHRLGACQIGRRRCSARCCGACCHMLCSSGVPCRAAPKPGDSGRHMTPLLAP